MIPCLSGAPKALHTSLCGIVSRHRLPFHALTWRGKGLAETHQISYRLNAGSLRGGSPDPITGTIPALIVGDPTNMSVPHYLSDDQCSARPLPGARSAIVTLWPVADNVTRDFMRSFYDALLPHTSVADALQQAQSQLWSVATDDSHKVALRDLKHRQVQSRSLHHPFFWAENHPMSNQTPEPEHATQTEPAAF